MEKCIGLGCLFVFMGQIGLLQPLPEVKIDMYVDAPQPELKSIVPPWYYSEFPRIVREITSKDLEGDWDFERLEKCPIYFDNEPSFYMNDVRRSLKIRRQLSLVSEDVRRNLRPVAMGPIEIPEFNKFVYAFDGLFDFWVASHIFACDRRHYDPLYSLYRLQQILDFIAPFKLNKGDIHHSKSRVSDSELEIIDFYEQLLNIELEFQMTKINDMISEHPEWFALDVAVESFKKLHHDDPQMFRYHPNDKEENEFRQNLLAAFYSMGLDKRIKKIKANQYKNPVPTDAYSNFRKNSNDIKHKQECSCSFNLNTFPVFLEIPIKNWKLVELHDVLANGDLAKIMESPLAPKILLDRRDLLLRSLDWWFKREEPLENMSYSYLEMVDAVAEFMDSWAEQIYIVSPPNNMWDIPGVRRFSLENPDKHAPWNPLELSVTVNVTGDKYRELLPEGEEDDIRSGLRNKTGYKFMSPATSGPNIRLYEGVIRGHDNAQRSTLSLKHQLQVVDKTLKRARSKFEQDLAERMEHNATDTVVDVE